MTTVFQGLRAMLLALALLAGVGTAIAETAAPLNQTADGVAMDGFDVVAYFTDGAPAKGDAAHFVEYQGAEWRFSSAENAAAFAAEPARYAPQSNGWCSYAVSEGYSAEVDFVNGWAVVDGALYLNWDQSVRDQFVAEQSTRIPASKANWPTVSAGITDGSVELYRHADDPSVGIAHPQPLP